MADPERPRPGIIRIPIDVAFPTTRRIGSDGKTTVVPTGPPLPSSQQPPAQKG